VPSNSARALIRAAHVRGSQRADTPASLYNRHLPN
jgi:hypothetical protein